MLTYTFEEKGNKPYYQYLYERLKADIESGVPAAGSRLPSKRSFAKQLGLSVMTIEMAYGQLMIEGYVYAVEKRGYFVSDVSGHPTAETRQEEPKYLQATEKPETAWQMDFASNRITAEHFPMTIWSRLMRKVLSEMPQEILMPSPQQGVFELRRAIAEQLYLFRGMNVSPEQIVIGAGTEYLYHLIIQLLGRNCIYAMEDPGYQKLAGVYRYNDVSFQRVRLDEKGLSVASLRRQGAEVIHTSPAHHFPTGIVMPVQRRKQLLAWAKESEKRYIIEDDYDCEFRFDGMPIPTLQSIDKEDKVIYLNTFSKSLTPSIRISYMVLPNPLLTLYREKLSFYACTVPTFEQYTLAAFLSKGYFEKHINRMRNHYRTQRNKVIGELKQSPLWEKVTISEEDAGLHFLMRMKTEKKDADTMAELQKKGIRIKCLSDYSAYENKSYEHIFVINYTGLEIDKLRQVFQTISDII